VGAAVYWRLQWGSGFDRLMGDIGDTRLAVYLCEHWFRVLHGQDSWLNPAFFYPVKGVLGWSDTFFLYQVFYAPLRLLGADPFLALELSIMLLGLVGFVCFVYLVRLLFDTPLFVALIGALIVVFGNSMWMHPGWVQLTGVYFVPPVLLLAAHAWRAATGHQPRLAAALGAAAGALWALILFSTFYVAWFSTLGLGVVAVLFAASQPRRLRTWLVTDLRARWWPVAGAAGGSAVGIVPFARTYLPVSENYSYSAAMRYAIRWQAVVDVGKANLVWGGLVRSVVPKAVRDTSELSFAVTPLLMILALGSGAVALYRLMTGRAARPAASRVAVATALVAGFFTVAPIKNRFGSLWIVLWQVPGAKAIRAIDRIEIVAALAAALAVAAASAELTARPLSRRRPSLVNAALTALVAVSALEQFNTANYSHLSRPAQLAFIRSVPTPPASCRTFFVVDSQQTLPYFEYQLDAMWISDKVARPTFNGYSGRFPPHWLLLLGHGPGYVPGAVAWARAHGLLAGLCEFDVGTYSWVPVPPSGPATESTAGIGAPALGAAGSAVLASGSR
jgi:hypothetical protein